MILEELNGPQREAVLHPPSPLLVLAGAGSGKTRVLTYRIAHFILERGVAPEHILAITFTNKAAGEMKDRVRSLLGEPCRDIWVLTFHSAASRILRLDGHHLGYSPGFSIYDQSDQKSLVRTCLKEMNLSEREFPPARLLAAIGRWKNEMQAPEDALETSDGAWGLVAAQVYATYQKRLFDLNAVDFDDLISGVVGLFQGWPEVLGRYQERFRHILVDEYQDTNHAQYLMVRQLASRYRSISVVGDDDQSIYGWRGADIRNIREFDKDFPNAHRVTLDQNYRSTQVILEAANAVIANNAGRRPKELWTRLQGGEPLTVFVAVDERQEARFVADEVEAALEQGRSLGDIAVFYRVHAQSRVLEEEFVRRGLPYRLVGGVRFYDRKEVKDILAYLRVLENPSDEVSLHRIVNIPRRGIGEATWDTLIAMSREKGVNLPALLLDESAIGRCYPGAREGLRGLGRLLEEMRKSKDSVAVAEMISSVVEGSGYLDDLEREGTPEALSRMENLKELVNTAAGFEALGEFLASVSLFTDIDALDEGVDAVTLMTLHSAKGLEFPVVFLVGLEEGLFPLQRSMDSPEALEEERRLCYVGMTRAKERLYLARAMGRTVYGSWAPYPPSRFLLEVPSHLTKGVSPQGDVSRPVPAPAPGAVQDLTCGDRVRHSKWGDCTIVSLHGEGEDQEATIAVDGMGLKRVLIKYAPMERVKIGGEGSDA